MRKRFLIVLAIILVAVSLCACNGAGPSVMEEKGVSMELPMRVTNATGQMGYQGYDFAYVGDEMAIFGSRGDLTAEGVDAETALETCAKNAMKSAEVEAELVTAEKGYVYFTYFADTGLNEFRNVIAFYKNGNDLWMIQVSCKDKSYDEAAVLAILDSVTFREN